jgi:hypothetical protein
MDDRAAYFHTLVPTPGVQSRRRRPACQLVNAATPSRARVVERTHAWMNGYGKLRRCTERNAKIVDFYLYLAAALVTIRQLIQRARRRYRWDTRPTTKRLK